MNRRRLCILCCLAVACGMLVTSGHSKDIDPEIAPEYDSVLRANKFLMQWGGVDTVTLTNGDEVLVGVGQVVLKSGATPADMLKARRAAETRAAAAVSQFLRTDITSVSDLVKRTSTRSEEVDNALQLRIRRVEKFLSTHVETRSQLTARIKRVGFWRSEDDQYQYAAVAVAPLP